MVFGERKRLLGDFLETVWSLGDVEACDRFIDNSYTVRHDPGDPWDGMTLDREGFKNRVRTSRAPFPDQRFDVISLLEDDTRSRRRGPGPRPTTATSPAFRRPVDRS